MKAAVSLYASSTRSALYPALLKSLIGTSVPIEIVFAGPLRREDVMRVYDQAVLDNPGLENVVPKSAFHFLETENIKPAQCYEIARRHCGGETVCWIADDCEFGNDVIGKAYNFWKEIGNKKLILSIQTKESGYGLKVGALFDMKNHSFFGFNQFTPLMAPLGLMSNQFLQELGGTDRRYICGQYENDIVMRAMAEGGKVQIFGDYKTFIDIDHLAKSYQVGEIKKEREFLNRPFAKGYPSDREVLEKSWAKDREAGTMNYVEVEGVKKYVRNPGDSFEPYEEKDLYTKSQSNNIPSMWE